jgi:hypothetical protein
MSRTIRATARCQFCDWKVKATGDDVVEVGTFLRRLCIEHTEREHAVEDMQGMLDAVRNAMPPKEED